MLISPPQPLNTGIRIALIVLSLFLLQVNVPVAQSASSIWISADLPSPRPETINVWLPAKSFLASARSDLHLLRTALKPPQLLAARSFKIVKIESKRIGNGNEVWPVKGSVSSPFGMRRHPVTKRNSFHSGIDIRARQGTGIVCPADGVVVSAGHAGLLGRLVKIKTTSGKILYFGHMHRIKCLKGQKIKRGNVIGTVGSSGRATGPHLHFSVVASGKYINPIRYLSAN